VKGLQNARASGTDHGLDFLTASGEAVQLIRDYDWSATPLGHPSTWSPTLRMMVRFILANRFPHLLWWGPDYIQFYNDYYSPVLGAKHPHESMGKPFRECWHEVYELLQPLVDTPFAGGPATWLDDLELIVRRHGFPEESHFTVAYSPVPDDTAPRGIGGVLATVNEITEKVIAERRVQMLGDLSLSLAEAKTDEQVCMQAVEVLSRYPKDVPFAMVYLLDADRSQLQRASHFGSAPPMATLSLQQPLVPAAKPLAQALATKAMQTVDDLTALLPAVPPGPWPDPPTLMVIVPLKSHTTQQPSGVLALGISACIRLDARYVGFLELVGSSVATAISNARAYEMERRRAEALAEIDRAKTIFFSNISHEFRTPLTLMLGPLEDVRSSADLPAHARSQLDVAQRNAQRLLRLVNSLLDFARIEAGRMQASFEPVDLAALTADLASTFRSAMQRAGLDYQVECPPLAEPVHIDRDMWEKIVLNLLSNAFKFTLSGGVTVRLRREDAHAVLEVSDTGTGVPAHELPRLFDRFHRVEGAQGRTHEGSGIGLALVQELVKLHDGSIEARSEPGAGATFTVRIPFGTAHVPRGGLVNPQRDATPARGAQVFVQEALSWLPDADTRVMRSIAMTEAPVWRADDRFASTYGQRVLVADDNADMRSYISGLLGAFYTVEAAEDGESALAAARRSRPALILCDVMMPKLDGLQLLAALRADAELHAVPVILLSARAGEEARIEGLGAGADDYIIKPFHARELLARIGAMLELSEVRRKSEEQFRTFVESTSDAMYRMSPDWLEVRHLVGRDLFAEQTGSGGNWLQQHIAEQDRPMMWTAIRRAIDTKTPFDLEHRVIRTDGSPGWVISRAIPVLDDDGAIVEWFGTASDVTTRHDTEELLQRQREQLEQADRQKNEFLAMLAHELRNPLAPIRHAGELLARSLPPEASSRLALDIIERQVRHLTRLVDDLLDISRVTQGHIELRRGPVIIEQVIAQALETVDAMARQKNHRLSVVSSPVPLRVHGDRERLIQCVGNILVNAVKYTPAEGEIRIETREASGSVCISISDNGVGISEELLPRIFDLFVQGERALERSQGGLGVGLTIVQRLIEMHGGTITARTHGTDPGSTFEIRLPLAQSAARSSSEPSDGR